MSRPALASTMATILLLLLVPLTLALVAAPAALGVRYLAVATGSMLPTIGPGDVVLTTPVNADSIREGDVVAYREDAQRVTTHRVAAVHRGDDGQLALTTKGDANTSVDAYRVSLPQLIGRVELVIPRVGLVTRAIRTPLGISILALIPIALLGAQGVLEVLAARRRAHN